MYFVVSAHMILVVCVFLAVSVYMFLIVSVLILSSSYANVLCC